MSRIQIRRLPWKFRIDLIFRLDPITHCQLFHFYRWQNNVWMEQRKGGSQTWECVQWMGERPLEGPVSPDRFGADGSLWPSTPDKGLSLGISREGRRKVPNLRMCWTNVRKALGDPAEEPLGVLIEFWVQTAPCGRTLPTKGCPLTSKHASFISVW